MKDHREYIDEEMGEYDDDGMSTEELLEWLESVGRYKPVKSSQ
jgi:hypothetical protein